MCQADVEDKGDGSSAQAPLHPGAEVMPLADIIRLKMKEIEDITSSDPWVTRTAGEASNYIAGHIKGIEEAMMLLGDLKIPQDWATTEGFQEGWKHACVEAYSQLRARLVTNSKRPDEY